MLNTPVTTEEKILPGRLRKRPEFLYVAKNGDKWISDSVIVQALKKNESDRVQCGYTATKKIGNAVVRNRAKRRLRAVVGDIVKVNDIVPSDIVLIARHSTVNTEWEKLNKDLLWCFKRLNLFEN